MTESPKTVSPARAWLRQASEDAGEVEWYGTFAVYALVSVIGAQWLGDGSVDALGLFAGVPAAQVTGWFSRRGHGTTAFVLGVATMVLGFVLGAGSW